jgi:DNA-binding transcriptional LysR family regulator
MDNIQSVHLRNVDLNLLIPLHALLEERHVTRAAKRVNLSQSAMNHVLDRLRDALSDDLLIRDGRRDYLLTARGQALLQELELVLPRLERLGHIMIEMDPNQQTLVDRPLTEIGKR